MWPSWLAASAVELAANGASWMLLSWEPRQHINVNELLYPDCTPESDFFEAQTSDQDGTERSEIVKRIEKERNS